MTDRSTQIIGMIPARFGSTRFPGKPLVKIQGKTLLQRTYENALKAVSLSSLIVVTDDQRIFDHVKDFGGLVIMTSPDHLTGTDRIAAAVTSDSALQKASVIVNIQGDEPCIPPVLIDKIAGALIQNPSAHMSTAVAALVSKEETESPAVVKCVFDGSKNAIYFSRSMIPSSKTGKWNPDQIYYRHIGIYGYTPSFLMTYQQLQPSELQIAEDLEQLKVLEHGYRIKVVIGDHEGIGVDNPEDIFKVEQWLCKQNSFL